MTVRLAIVLRRVVALLATLVATAPVAAHPPSLPHGEQGRASPPEYLNLILKWRHQFQFAGLYVADEEGYFHREGLAVTLHERRPGVDPVEEVLAGRMDYGISSASRLLIAHGRGDPVVVLGVIVQHSPLVLLSLDPSLRTPADLAGRRIAIADDDAEVRALLRREGVALASLHTVPHPAGLDALVSGAIDGLTGYRTNEPFTLAQQGHRVTVIDPVDYGVRFYGDVLFTSRHEWDEHRDRALRVRDAVFAGWDTALADPPRTIERLAHRFAGNKTRAALEYEATELRGLIHPDAVPIGHSSNYRWRQMQEHLAAAGLIDDALSLEPLLAPIDDEQALRERRRLQWLLAALLAIGLLGIAHIVSLRLAVRRAAREIHRSHAAVEALNRDLEQRIVERTGELAAERDRANALRRSRDQQLTQVTHELHSPLHGILGNIGLLLDDGDHLSAGEQRTLLGRVQKQARRLLGLVDHLLTSANLEAGTLGIQREPLDLDEETRQTLALMAEEDPGRLARVQFTAGAGPLRCLADRQRLRQAIRALVDNALRYSAPPAPVEVSVCRSEAGQLWLDVSDRGPGIPEAERDRIFDRFAQGEASRGRAGGAGLGLSIARGLVEIHGGALLVDNRAGGGARFRLVLPALQTAVVEGAS